MKNDNTPTILAQALEQQHKQLLCMLDALQIEHRALASPDIEKLEHAVRNKQVQIKALEDIQSQLTSLEPMLNGKFSKDSIERYIGNMSAGQNKTQLTSMWKKLQATTISCSEQNIINHRIMDASGTQLRQAINILRGDLTGPTVDIYGASGKQNNNAHGQSLATA